MTICLKHYIRDYVTKCNFLTYHVYFIHVFVFVWFFYQSGNPFFLFLFCNLFCMPIVICLLFMLLLVDPKLVIQYYYYYYYYYYVRHLYLVACDRQTNDL